jgi:repressor LexA
MKVLTSTQASVLAFIREHIDREQCPPTRAEVATRFKWASPNAAEDHIRALAKKGYVEIRSGRARGIRVTPLGALS